MCFVKSEGVTLLVSKQAAAVTAAAKVQQFCSGIRRRIQTKWVANRNNSKEKTVESREHSSQERPKSAQFVRTLSECESQKRN